MYLIKFVLFINLVFCSFIYAKGFNNNLSVKKAVFMNKNPGGKPLNTSKKNKYLEIGTKIHKEGFKFYKNKKDKEAVIQYEEALKYYSTAKLYYDYANSLSNIDRLYESIESYKIALKLKHPQPYLVLYNIACAYSRLKNKNKSYDYLKSAVRAGYRWFNYMKKDKDLVYLRKDPNWKIVFLGLKKEYKKRFKKVKYDFRKIRWGMSFYEVKKAERKSHLLKVKKFYYKKWLKYTVRFNGLRVILSYYFEYDRLKNAGYNFISLKDKEKNLTGFYFQVDKKNYDEIKDYIKIKLLLEKKFGMPVIDDKKIVDKLKTTFYTEWLYKRTKVFLKLVSSKSKLLKYVFLNSTFSINLDL